MVKVSLDIAEQKISSNSKVNRIYQLMRSDLELQNCLQMANTMAVKRLNYNDHGPVHARIVAGTALEIYDYLRGHIEPSIIKDAIGDESDSKLVVFCGAYLHDIGNSIHREMHHISGCIVASPILTRLLSKIYEGENDRSIKIRQEILQSIFAHENDIKCLSFEAGVSKIADGCDMAEGRARIPYRMGKVDIHSLSALSIVAVEVGAGENAPLRITVQMNDSAGIFQLENVLMKKVETSGLVNKVEVVARKGDRVLKRIDPATSE